MATIGTDVVKDKRGQERVVLPLNINPKRYDLKITPDLKSFTFEGQVAITLETLEGTTNQITVHAKQLLFVSAQLVKNDNDAPLDCIEFRSNVKATTVTLVFGENVPPNSTCILTINYTGFINNDMAGFYRSSYKDPVTQNTMPMASTQFECLDARRAFPCWDEPARKAIFAVTFCIEPHLDCVSNMPERSNQILPDTGKRQIVFMDSPIMSTYLLAFAVGQFDYLQAMTEKGVLVKVYAPTGRAKAGAFALECATKVLDAFDDFFQVRYPLPKLDLMAVPDFAAGAMENWGLVTFREVDMLIDPLTASNQQIQRVAEVVAHELAHQWFGNLVTMDWWDDLWLNEGFASWAQNWAGNLIHPEYELWNQFTTSSMTAAFRLDALKSSHPIQVPIRHAEEVESVFDAISYCKGGSVVRMARAVLGPKAFQEGLGAYMKRHKYGNSQTVDLWTAWEEASGMPVKELMASWTEQMGFPYLRVVKEQWESDKVTLDLEQQWFLADGSELTDEEAQKKWTIPILTCTEEGTQADMVLMREKTATVTIPLKDEGGWVKLNAGQEVLMRVLNTPEMIARLAKGIRSKTLPPCDRAALLMDSYALVKAGHMAPESLIKLVANYDAEDSYIVWQGLGGVLSGLHAILSSDETMSANFDRFAKKLIVNLIPLVGWEPTSEDGHLTVLLRSTMIGLLSSFCHDDETVIKEARERFAKFLENPNDVKSLPSDMRVPVFQIVAKNGGETEYNQLLSYFTTADNNAQRLHVLRSLGHIKDEALKLRLLEWNVSGAVKAQDLMYSMNSVSSSNNKGSIMSWQFFKNNFKTIEKFVGGGSMSNLMDACIVASAGNICSEERINDFEQFFVENPFPSSARKIAQLLENMRANAKLFEILKQSELSKESFWTDL